jgi:hypothetical protein
MFRNNCIYCIPLPPPHPPPTPPPPLRVTFQILIMLLAKAVYMTAGPPGEIQVSFDLSWLSFPLPLHLPIGHRLLLKKCALTHKIIQSCFNYIESGRQ